MPRLALLHTSDLHPETFDRLAESLDVDLQGFHDVHEDLLLRARESGAVTSEIRNDLKAALLALQAKKADAVLCTCSTLGHTAERIGQEIGMPVLRIDRALAEAAFEEGQNLLVTACLLSTMQPTEDLLRSVAVEKMMKPKIDMLLIDHAWSYFEAGDNDNYAKAIADGVSEALDGHDAVVLAQASMACAEPLLEGLGVPVLSSPLPGLKRGLAIADASAAINPR